VREDELSHKGVDRAVQINRTIIDSNDYRRKFDNATDNPKLNKTLYECAKEILYDRSGTHYESMYWIDGGTGEIITSFDIMGKIPALTGKEHELVVEYTDRVLHKLKGHNNVVVIHNHPNSTAPSAGDLNSANDHGYSLGFVAAHDGRLFKYSSNQEINVTMYDLYWTELCNDGFDETIAQIKAIEKIARNADIFVTEVTNL
jgi:proteasome lid subunit RPN8/RPN11